MERIDKEIIVAAPVEAVFSYINIPSNWVQFWPSLISIDDVKPLPNGGFSARYEYKMFGMHFHGTGKYINVVPNHWIVVKTQHGITSTITCTFREISDGVSPKTRVTLTIDYKIPIPLLGRVAERVILKVNNQEADLVLSNIQAIFSEDPTWSGKMVNGTPPIMRQFIDLLR